MAKIIKYQRVTERKDVYLVPITEEVEKEVARVVEKVVEKQIETVVEKVVDGKIVTETVIETVPEIVHETVTETVTETVIVGYEEKVDVQQILSPVEITCSDSNFEANYAVAEKEAYNGEIAVKDAPDPVTKPTTDDILNAMLGVE